MKKLQLIACFLLIASIWSCNKSEKQEGSGKPLDSAAMATNDFLVSAHQSILAKLEFAAFGSKTNSLEIRNFCDMILKQDRLLLDSIATIASQKSVLLADSVSGATREHIKQLQDLQGQDLERALIRALSAEHRRLVGAFRRNRRNLDTDIKAFVARNITLLKSQSDAMQELRKAMRETQDDTEKRAEKPA